MIIFMKSFWYKNIIFNIKFYVGLIYFVKDLVFYSSNKFDFFE